MEENVDGDNDHNDPNRDENGHNNTGDVLDERPSGMDDQETDNDDDGEEQPFDITLAATHSYMGPGLEAVRGREVVEAGWCGRVVVVAHHGAVFPGETVPLLLPRADHAVTLARALTERAMFGLLCPDELGFASGYGALCEVYEASAGGERSLSVKARAVHRFRFRHMPKQPYTLHRFTGEGVEMEVEVLPELGVCPPLQHARLQSLDPRRPQLPAELRRLEASVSPWPAFVYDMFDYTRMRQTIKEYFSTFRLEAVPSDPVALSFWVASNLQLQQRDRLALLLADGALQRLALELRLIHTSGVLCCASCLTDIARREHVFAMSSDGLHSNYTNLGGFVHDVVTVSRAHNISLEGGASHEYSWFPGYTWSIALCRLCAAHVGWRFDAMKRRLRPQQFYGLCRNQVRPAPTDRSHL
ncbi:unnamed protein product [Chilo suppressalis]|uniref:Protein cereblon n=1 Tax=Chilo suppressalis TaxID=168631 RepID=A0ABN8E9G5_CHISP|nr:unnamed protein product [Chilo suppressalis]